MIKINKVKKVINANKPTNKGWNTSDSDEIKRRKIRARVEELLVKNEGKGFDYFGDFIVISIKSETKYLVEIR